MKIAISQHPISGVSSFENYCDRVEQRLQRLKMQKVSVVCMPEFGSYELTNLLDSEYSIDEQADAMQEFAFPLRDFYAKLAKELDLCICTPSFIFRSDEGWRNRAWVVSPEGIDFQDKLHPSIYEQDFLGVNGGKELKVFNCKGLKFIVCLGIDIEYDAVINQAIEQGIKLIIMPAATDNPQSYNRAKIAAQMRAMQHNIYVAWSPLIGRFEHSGIIESAIGEASLFGPIDEGFPENGIVNQAKPYKSGWLIERLSANGLRALQENSQFPKTSDSYSEIVEVKESSPIELNTHKELI
ncbi:nitrilase-related carbon-nitrogen hydrolase [Marinicellulosiphila megalodicopiae]|uniref:nitrilase-related carbon-nitrogen hydrolase n=1 Tax=Marinicellulosiphila megalodicopiae TaxID=2724896 RepID=UPI003BB195BB